MPRHILLADDDRVLSDLLRKYFEGEGFAVSQAFDGAQAVARAAETRFDVIVADVMMPVMDGFEALRALRKAGDTPVIMLTARGGDVDRIVGLEMGADDYLPKPFNPRELLARVKAVLRRAEPRAGMRGDEAQLAGGGLELDVKKRSAHARGAPLALTDAEFGVLEMLLRARGELVGRDELSLGALGKKLGPHDRGLDMHISHLRKKLDGAKSAVKIVTVRGRGFFLDAPAGEKDGGGKTGSGKGAK
ncbi:MAG: response regulator transcription factor [Gammaproteobacteria bacterium]|nr:response regulator transcription factor [Gammaproteobacteria bacterium]